MIDLALAFWEYLITLANEVDIFWRKPVTVSSVLFIGTRWIMLANALLQIAPITEATSVSMLLLCLSDIDIFISNCDAMIWAIEAFYLVQFVGSACKQAYFTASSIFVFTIVHSIFRHTSICGVATKLYMGLYSFASGTCSRSDKLSKLT